MLVACGLLVVGGCGSDADGGAASGSPASPVSAASVAAIDEAAALEAWRAWRSSEQVVAKQYTPEEAERLRVENAELNRPDSVGPEVPVPDVVSWSGFSMEPIVRCIQEAGFPGARDDGTGFSFTISDLSPSQSDLYHRVAWECAAKYPLAPQTMDGDEETGRRVEYEYFTTFYLECLERVGFAVSREGIPSKEQWVADSLAGKEEWDPVLQMPLDPSRQSKSLVKDPHQLSRVCPHSPPWPALVGE